MTFPRFFRATDEDVPPEVQERRARFAAGPLAKRAALRDGTGSADAINYRMGKSPEETAEAFGRAAFAAYGRDWPKLMEIARGAAIRAHGDAMGEKK